MKCVNHFLKKIGCNFHLTNAVFAIFGEIFTSQVAGKELGAYAAKVHVIFGSERIWKTNLGKAKGGENRLNELCFPRILFVVFAKPCIELGVIVCHDAHLPL